MIDRCSQLPRITILVVCHGLCCSACSVLVDTACSDYENFCPPRSECVDGDCVEVLLCDGGLRDLSTGLCWQNPPAHETYDWSSAIAYCDTLYLGGHGPGEWRLPSIDEHRSLFRGCPQIEPGGDCDFTDECLDWDCYNDACRGCPHSGGYGAGGAYWPVGFDGPEGHYWASSRLADETFTVYSHRGMIFGYSESEYNYVRCVRDAP